jgi:hypothetical protein
MSRSAHRWILAVAGIAWLAAVGAGFLSLRTYASVPGAAAEAPGDWPVWSRIPAPRGRAVLVMTMHPHCPCTRASVSELRTLMQLVREHGVSGYVLAVKPADFPESWIRTASYRDAASIPGVAVLIDEEGVESSAFGAHTSGQVLLYDAAGQLQFAGGITPDRGHVGDSPGRARILSLLEDGTADAHESLVFGCPLGATSCPLPHRRPKEPVNEVNRQPGE